MNTSSTPTASTLVGLPPGPLTGQQFGLANGYLLVGRGPECWIRLGDPHVSRRHAALTVDGVHAWLEDLGSAEGTFINGQRVRDRRELRRGDVLKFAVVRMRYESIGPAAGGARFDIDSQAGDAIINVGGNYYQQRDSLLREIAATRTRGRRLVGVGFALFLVGLGVFAAAVLGFMSQIASGISSGSTRPPSSPFGPLVFGVPSGLLGWALGLIGMVLIVLGIVQHVVATARRRRVDRDMPPYEPRRVR